MACLGVVIAGPAAAQSGTSLAPSGANQHYVAPHFDRSGAYIPPHYEPRTKKKKPHGFFTEKPDAPAEQPGK